MTLAYLTPGFAKLSTVFKGKNHDVPFMDYAGVDLYDVDRYVEYRDYVPVLKNDDLFEAIRQLS